jgi:hypothetical protein
MVFSWLPFALTLLQPSGPSAASVGTLCVAPLLKWPPDYLQSPEVPECQSGKLSIKVLPGSIALNRIDAYTVEATLKKAGRIVLTNRVVYSKDGKLRTITGKGTNANGQPTTNVVVYERQ